MAKGFTSPTGDYIKHEEQTDSHGMVRKPEKVVYRHPLNPQQFGQLYHGSTSDLSPGQMLTSSHERGVAAVNPTREGGKYHSHNTFAGTSADYSEGFSPAPFENEGEGGLYKVKPTGPLYADRVDSGNSANPEAVMSHHPMQVQSKVTDKERGY